MEREVSGTMLRMARIILNIARNKIKFLVLVFVIFFVTFALLVSVDFIPEKKASKSLVVLPEAPSISVASVVVANNAQKEVTTKASSNSTSVAYATGSDLPVKITIPAVGVNVSVSNPVSTNIDGLDRDLLSGAVRYPTSAKLGEEGNVVIFGHSSYLPVVKNQNFKAFNDIQDLKAGDKIYVSNGDVDYIYAVERVDEMKRETGIIPLSVSGKKLTLSTCNSFGTPQDRFVVTANFVGSKQANS